MHVLALIGSPRKGGNTDLLVEMFRRSFAFLEMEYHGAVLGTAYDKGDVLRDRSAMDAARALGESL